MVKKADGLSVDNLITAAKIIFAEFWLPKDIMLDAGTNFISDKFRQFYQQLNIEQTNISSYNHQSNDQVDVCNM